MNKKAFLAKSNDYYQKLGITKETATWEDGIRSTGGKGTYEWWYFDAEYTDGTKVVVVFYTKDGFDVKGPANPTASLEATLPDGRKISKYFSEGKGQKIRALKDQCRVKIGESSIKYSKGNYLIHFVDGDVEYTCTMRPKLPMWRPGTGHWFYGEKQEHYFAWFVPVPSADVRATLKVKGETFQLKGNGYHDHNWGNIDMNKLMNHWYWGRVNIGTYTIIACDIIAEKKYGCTRLPVIMLAKDGTILEDDEEKVEVKRSGTECHPVTKKFIDNKLNYIYHGENGANYNIEFKRESDILAISLLDKLGLPAVKKLAAKALRLNPTYIRCIGEVKVTVGKDGKKEVFEKEGLWEQMFFGSNKDAVIEKDN
ncbi:MAG: hypothetical protein ABRQ25_18665 [Clostridiaceae bacterium]